MRRGGRIGGCTYGFERSGSDRPRADPPNVMADAPSTKIVAVHGGAGARVQLICLRAAGRVVGWSRVMQWIVWVLGWLFDRNNGVTIELPCGGKLRLLLNDGYWISLISLGHEYEPEVGFLLRHLLGRRDAFFLDCGANIGYWSVVASGLTGPGRVIAVEAVPQIFDRLSRNAALNSGRFSCVLAAVWHRDDERLSLVCHRRRTQGRASSNFATRSESPDTHTTRFPRSHSTPCASGNESRTRSWLSSSTSKALSCLP